MRVVSFLPRVSSCHACGWPYRNLIRFFGDRDPTTRRMLEDILILREGHPSLK
jgi:hypothetical protein